MSARTALDVIHPSFPRTRESSRGVRSVREVGVWIPAFAEMTDEGILGRNMLA